MVVTMKNAIFWDVMPYDSCKNITRATWHHIPEEGILYFESDDGQWAQG
jgi:hypothetical protein